MHITAVQWTDRFQQYLETERRVSPHTQSAYRHDLAALVRFCERSGIQDWIGLDARQVRNFAARSHASGFSPPSVQRRLSAVRTFQKFLIREGVLSYNTAKDISGPRMARRLPQTLTADEMILFIEGPKEADQHFIRDRAIIELFYSSGLRLAELVGLNLSNLDLSDRTVRVLGKGNRERIVPVGRMAATAITRYLSERKRFVKPGETALFLGRHGRRLASRAVQLRVELWAKRSGIRQHVIPHLFRHTCATHLLESSSSIRDVQEFLGHASVSTTAIYTHLNFQHLSNAYIAAHPRAKAAAAPGPLPDHRQLPRGDHE